MVTLIDKMLTHLLTKLSQQTRNGGKRAAQGATENGLGRDLTHRPEGFERLNKAFQGTFGTFCVK